MSRLPLNSTMKKIIEDFGFGTPVRQIIHQMNPNFYIGNMSDEYLWKIILEAMEEPVGRKKNPRFNTIEDAVELIKKSQKIMVISGAGISTSAGLPDFRSRDGIYKQIHAKNPTLADPKLVFDISYFRINPNAFYQFAKALYPGQFDPTIGHRFIRYLEKQGKLLKNYTQNIDTLERQAGITRLIECHGSFATASCTSCRYRVTGDVIKDDVLNQRIPLCPKCQQDSDGPNDGLGVMKPDIVFFGEPLGDEFHSSFQRDKDQVDLLIVIGSSMKVKPVALIPRQLNEDIPQILINREPLDHMDFDIELYGNCDEILQELCLKLGERWTEEVCSEGRSPLRELTGPSHLRPPVSQLSPRPENSRESDETVRYYNLLTGEDSDEDPDCVVIQGGSEQSRKQATAVSSEQNAIPKGGEREANKRDGKGDSDQDWSDVETSDSQDQKSDRSKSKVELVLPEGSYVHLKPNYYLFPGFELTNKQFESRATDQ